jgi:hypothetical protein
MIDRSRERQVSKVAHFDNLDGPVGEDVKHVPPPAADSVVAVVAPLHGDQERDSLHVGVHQRQKGTEVVSVNSVVDAMRQLDVLLRHRLLRHPGGFEGILNAPTDRTLDQEAVSNSIGDSDADVGFDPARRTGRRSDRACSHRGEGLPQATHVRRPG